ncbi:hypothetical protein I316_06419 [Kwoniella heveanensis BCC8398]|uniref:Bacterial CdiA-CT RNAse A domain-containing protein n=1 Tax=Kwoniella heveanensis BCC8398 TaxID=1296120 RepID=A0A1B9GLI4_9TREE|nr:hypothetical protein I316_06419 [Kwoniella heveanensis BCC8398]
MASVDSTEQRPPNRWISGMRSDWDQNRTRVAALRSSYERAVDDLSNTYYDDDIAAKYPRDISDSITRQHVEDLKSDKVANSVIEKSLAVMDHSDSAPMTITSRWAQKATVTAKRPDTMTDLACFDFHSGPKTGSTMKTIRVYLAHRPSGSAAGSAGTEAPTIPENEAFREQIHRAISYGTELSLTGAYRQTPQGSRPNPTSVTRIAKEINANSSMISDAAFAGQQRLKDRGKTDDWVFSMTDARFTHDETQRTGSSPVLEGTIIGKSTTEYDDHGRPFTLSNVPIRVDVSVSDGFWPSSPLH